MTTVPISLGLTRLRCRKSSKIQKPSLLPSLGLVVTGGRVSPCSMLNYSWSLIGSFQTREIKIYGFCMFASVVKIYVIIALVLMYYFFDDDMTGSAGSPFTSVFCATANWLIATTR